MGFVDIYSNDIEKIKFIVKLWGEQVEIVIGLIIAVIWHTKSNKDRYYDEEDWEKIKNDWSE